MEAPGLLAGRDRYARSTHGWVDNLHDDALTHTVRVTDAFSGLPGLGANDGLMAGLYLNNLEMGVGSYLIISSNVQVYFEGSNTWTSFNYLLEGNPTFDNSISGLHQLAVIPEPGVAFLWLCGFVTVYAARRRARNQKS